MSLAVSAQAPDPPNELRSYLRSALRPDRDVEDGECDRWLDTWSLPLSDLSRALLAQVDTELGLGADGQTLAASTAVRFRTVAKSCIRRAVELEVISSDPWPPASRGRSQRKSVKPKRSIDARTLPDPATMARAIEAMRSHQPASRTFQLMTAVAYYAGLRPSEVVMLRG